VKTEILFGHGYKDNPMGKSTLDEVLFTTHNIVPLGGVSFVFGKLFEANDSITVPTLYDQKGIGIPNSTVPTETYYSPDGEEDPSGNRVRRIKYYQGNYVQLFGVGITGTSENDISIYKPDYRENTIEIDKTISDLGEVTGQMLPFRYTAEDLTTAEQMKYFGKKSFEGGITGYYLKRFETDAVIKHIWNTGADIDDEVMLTDEDAWTNTTTSSTNSVESFTEMYLQINKKDLKEFFESIDEEDKCRFNTMALFTGRYVREEDDFEDVKLFSKLCINPEFMTLTKDLDCIYRIYGA
jgi:hypothetical protein